jgi:peptidylprolyl isomerase
MLISMLFAALAQAAPVATPPAPKSPGEIAAGAPAGEWIAISPDDLLVMDLGPGTGGVARRVVIQLVPAPVSKQHVANIRTLARAHWWDGTSVNRVQDNYVAQWGDATEKKPLPAGLTTVSESDYETPWTALDGSRVPGPKPIDPFDARMVRIDGRDVARPVDVYAPGLLYYRGWPLGTDLRTAAGGRSVWPLHCYGYVGVGRNLSPDTGTGAELYAVIGHAPRHLDRNIAVVGRVVQGIEHLSALPRGTAALGFYDAPEQRVGITSVRLASDLAPAQRPRFEYLSTDGATFVAYANARRNRELPFFFKPADAADVCNIPVPVRPAR